MTMGSMRAWLKRCLRRWRDRCTRRRLRRAAASGRVVAVVSTWEFPNPTHTFVLQDMLGLRAAGFELAVFCGERVPAPDLAARFRPLVEPLAIVETLGDVHRADFAQLERHHRDRLQAFLARLAAATGRAVEDLRQEPLVLRAATFTRLVELSGARWLQSWFCYDGSFLAMFAAQVLGLPRVLSCYVDHVLDDHPMKCVPLQLATADLVLATSERTRHELLAIGGAAGAAKILVKRIGVDATTLRALRGTRRAMDPLVIVSVCRLEPKKGLSTLVDAAAVLRQRGRRCRIRLVGGPDRRQAGSEAYEASLRQRVVDAGLQDVVEFVGAIAHDRLAEVLGAAAVFAAPYVELPSGDKDGMPTSVIEAMAAGLPVVATRSGSLPEVVRDDETGLLVPPGDAGALAAALERLLDDASLRGRLGQAAAARFDREFDHRVVDRAWHDRLAMWMRGEGGPRG